MHPVRPFLDNSPSLYIKRPHTIYRYSGPYPRQAIRIGRTPCTLEEDRDDEPACKPTQRCPDGPEPCTLRHALFCRKTALLPQGNPEPGGRGQGKGPHHQCHHRNRQGRWRHHVLRFRHGRHRLPGRRGAYLRAKLRRGRTACHVEGRPLREEREPCGKIRQPSGGHLRHHPCHQRLHRNVVRCGRYGHSARPLLGQLHPDHEGSKGGGIFPLPHLQRKRRLQRSRV